MSIAFSAALLCAAQVVRAAPTLVSGASLSVVRATGAEDCPDAPTLAASLRALGTNTSEPAGPLELEVSFAHGSGEYSALLVSRGRSAGERELRAAGETCAGVASSVAVALAVLLDLRPRASASLTEQRALSPHTASPAEPQHPALALDASAGAAYGLLGPRPSAIVSGALQLSALRWQLAAGALWSLPRSVERGAGRVAAELIAGRVAACRIIPYADEDALGACASVLGGVIEGTAHGYSLNGSESRAWGAASASALWTVQLFHGLALRTELQALVSFRRQEFSIEGLGVVYHSSPGAAWLEIGPELTIW